MTTIIFCQVEALQPGRTVDVGLIIVLLLIWLVLVVVGFVVKALLWLAIVGIVFFVATAIFGAIRGRTR